mgnify:CR=1 FL=1
MTPANLPLAFWKQVCEQAISAQIGPDDSSHTPMEMKRIVFRATFSPSVVLRLLEVVEHLQQERDAARREQYRQERLATKEMASSNRANRKLMEVEQVVERQREALIAASGCIKLLDRNPTHGDGVDSILEQIVAALTQETT